MQEIKKNKNSEKHYLNGKLHRVDGPAVTFNNGTQKWFIEGKLHREDGPAIIEGSTVKYYKERYFIHGKEMYPESLEAFLCMKQGVFKKNDVEQHYLNYELHREDGPASINHYEESWYIKGKLHRLDAPAQRYKAADYWSEEWYHDGTLHRDNGPARLDSNGEETWYQHGILHREDGPAEIKEDYKNWWVNGQLHRLDGPAMERKYIYQRKWYVNGTRLNVYSTAEFVKHMKMRAFW